MTATPMIFGDGVIDVHVANGVARITVGAVTGQQDAKPAPSGMLVVPVVQLPALARVFAEVSRQVEARAREAVQQAQARAAAQPEQGAQPDQVSGAFRFNG